MGDQRCWNLGICGLSSSRRRRAVVLVLMTRIAVDDVVWSNLTGVFDIPAFHAGTEFNFAEERPG